MAIELTLQGFPAYAAIRRAANQNVANTGTTIISWDTQDFDNSSMWAIGDPTKIYVPGSGNKLVTISAQVTFAAGSSSQRRVIINKNGSSTGKFADLLAVASDPTYAVSVCFQFLAVGGDYFEIIATQASATNPLTVTAYLDMSVVDLE